MTTDLLNSEALMNLHFHFQNRELFNLAKKRQISTLPFRTGKYYLQR
jgi:hypothetical protein